MVLLTPTVHERLARCGTRIFVDGLAAGADVELDVGGSVTSFAATGAGSNVVVGPLAAGAKVTARQNDGSGWTPWSPEVIVEDADVPPGSVPHLPASVGNCSQCVWVTGLVPGSEVELLQGTSVVGTSTADRHGRACVGVTLRQDEVLRGRMIVCGDTGPQSSTPLAADTALPKPVVGTPLYACQRIVPLSELRKGSRVRLESDTSGGLGSVCTCWNPVSVRVDAELVEGHKIRAQSYWDGETCKSEGAWGDWKDVVPPDEGIKPELLDALVEGDRTIRVANQISGSELTIFIAATENAADIANPDSFGPRSASEEQEIDLNAPLKEGNVVWVEQSLCGRTEPSDPVVVDGLPDIIYAPMVIPPLHDCGGMVTVTRLHAGAQVRVFQNGFVIGIGWSGMANSLVIDTASLIAGRVVTAKQWVGGNPSPDSEPVTVKELTEMYTPRVVEPVTRNDHAVWVSGVTPGARVAIHSDGVLIGETESGESLVRVPTSAITGGVTATVSLCTLENDSGEAVAPLDDPCERGPWATTGSKFKGYESFTVDNWVDGGGFSHPIEGQLYYPTAPGGCLSPGSGQSIDPNARNLPLVIIAHGYWTSIDSYLGYGYLAHHLASWGMVVYSLNLNTVNSKHFSTTDPPHQSARGEIILKAIEKIYADSKISGHLADDVVGLIGHSMGGEGVVIAQSMNLNRANPYGIKAVVSIAPTQYRPNASLAGCEYLQLLGSEDYLLGFTANVLGNDASVIFNGFRIYGRAERNKSHAWIYGASHDPFNTMWVGTPNSYPVTDAQHRAIAMCLMNALFQKALKGESQYGGYLEGLVKPPAIRSLEIYMQYLAEDREVLDNFGDADPQAGLPAEALDRNSNHLGPGVIASGPGLVNWDDVETVGTGQCLHNTKSTVLSWRAPDVGYSSPGSLALPAASKNLSFRICQFYEDADKNPEDREIDLLVEIGDGAETATVRMGMVGLAPYPDDALQPYSVFRTIRIPADAFGAVNPALNLSALTGVTLRLVSRATGHILVDDIEWEV